MKTLTNEQVSKIKEINATSRDEALEQVAKIMNTKTIYTSILNFAKNTKEIYVDGTTLANISYSKGKVKRVDFYEVFEASYGKAMALCGMIKIK
jgi:hypothetical protein